MGAKKFKDDSKDVGIFYKKHATRKHGVAYDRCWIICYKYEGRNLEESVGWASQGTTKQEAKDFRAERMRDARRKRDGLYDGPVTRRERKAHAEALRQAEEAKAAAEALRVTVKEFSEQYMSSSWRLVGKVKKELSKVTVEEDQRRFNTDVLPVIGHRLVEDITFKDLESMVETLQSKSPVSGNRLLSLLRKVFSAAVREGIIGSSPATNLVKLEEHARERVLDSDEIKAFWEYLNANRSKVTADLIRVLMLTGKRTGEVLGMRWSEIKDDVWTIPKGRTKNRKKSVVVYLSEPVLEILKQRKNDSDYVFPSRAGHQMNSKVCARFVHRSPFDFKPHDLRRTATTLMAEAEVDPHIAERVLGHSDGSVRGQVYDRAKYENKLREAWNVLAEEVFKCIS